VILQLELLPILTATHGSAILLCLHLSWTITGTLSATAMRKCIAMDHHHPATKLGRWDSLSIISTTLF
jgi:hypothetical protein